MYIIGVDPGLQTGVALLDTVTGMIDGWVDDSRGEKKEKVAQNVFATVQGAIYNTPPKANIQIVAEDFVLRYGQAVDTTPLYVLGALDQWNDFKTVKYSPGTHKNGNKAYNITKMLHDQGYNVGEGGHLADALSLSLHHWKVLDTLTALEFLEDYR